MYVNCLVKLPIRDGKSSKLLVLMIESAVRQLIFLMKQKSVKSSTGTARRRRKV